MLTRTIPQVKFSGFNKHDIKGRVYIDTKIIKQVATQATSRVRPHVQMLHYDIRIRVLARLHSLVEEIWCLPYCFGSRGI